MWLLVAENKPKNSHFTKSANITFKYRYSFTPPDHPASCHNHNYRNIKPRIALRMAQCHYDVYSGIVKGCRGMQKYGLSSFSDPDLYVNFLFAKKWSMQDKMRVQSCTSVYLFLLHILYYLHTFTFSGNYLYHPLPTDCMNSTHTHPYTPRHTLACRQGGRQFLWAELSALCWESLVACMPVASWWESRKTCCCYRGYWPVCHLFQGNQRLQEINSVENTHRDNDGKRQQRETVRLKWKPCCQVLIMSFLNKHSL